MPGPDAAGFALRALRFTPRGKRYYFEAEVALGRLLAGEVDCHFLIRPQGVREIRTNREPAKRTSCHSTGSFARLRGRFHRGVDRLALSDLRMDIDGFGYLTSAFATWISIDSKTALVEPDASRSASALCRDAVARTHLCPQRLSLRLPAVVCFWRYCRTQRNGVRLDMR